MNKIKIPSEWKSLSVKGSIAFIALCMAVSFGAGFVLFLPFGIGFCCLPFFLISSAIFGASTVWFLKELDKRTKK